jgi:hypothetical protein
MTQHELLRFVDEIPDVFLASGRWPVPPGGGESGHDQVALALQDRLKVLGSPLILHGEGLETHGIQPVPRERRGRFAGSGNYPDMALIVPDYAVAIEVDRARGYGGASLRNALTKGWFNVLTGKFQRCVVLLFFDPGPMP